VLTIAEAQKRTEQFLTGPMLQALHTVDYKLPSFERREMAARSLPRHGGSAGGERRPAISAAIMLARHGSPIEAPSLAIPLFRLIGRFKAVRSDTPSTE
jgi:hypothetical protein